MNAKLISRKAIRVSVLVEICLKTAINRRGRRGNIAMFHAGRCGSTVLGEMLNQHPKIIWAGEIFNNMPHQYPHLTGETDRARMILQKSMFATSSLFYGFTTKFLPGQQLSENYINMRIEEYIDFLKNNGFYYFIILKRKNHLRRIVSNAVGKQIGFWHTQEEIKKTTVVTIRKSCFNNAENWFPLPFYFDEVERQYLYLEKLLQHEKYIKLVYEDDIYDNPIVAYAKVCKLLNIDSDQPMIKSKITNPFQLSEIIKNFNEVEESLRGTKHEWMLYS